ncbi:hypothetical protein VTO73DRAFT_7696 [Trametes versicolor]
MSPERPEEGQALRRGTRAAGDARRSSPVSLSLALVILTIPKFPRTRTPTPLLQTVGGLGQRFNADKFRRVKTAHKWWTLRSTLSPARITRRAPQRE